MISNSNKDNSLYKTNGSWRFAPPAGVAGDYIRLSGSSMSTGVVSGVVALMLEANRTDTTPDGKPMAPLTPFDVKAILEYTATDTGAEALAQGAGEVNAAGAVALVRALDTRWTPWAVQAVTPATTTGGETLPWARTIVWGNYPATGTVDDLIGLTHGLFVNGVPWGGDVSANARNVVWGNTIVSANARNVVWGNADLSANARNVVWGNARNVVWGNSLLCAVAEICY